MDLGITQMAVVLVFAVQGGKLTELYSGDAVNRICVILQSAIKSALYLIIIITFHANLLLTLIILHPQRHHHLQHHPQ